MSEREGAGIRERKIGGDHIFLYFCFTTAIGSYSVSKEVLGFCPLSFPRGKSLCLLSLVIDCSACYSLR